jgi:tight adherence protein B
MFLALYVATPSIGARSLGRFGDEELRPDGWRERLQRRLDQAELAISAGEFVKAAALVAALGLAAGYAITATVTGTLFMGALGPFGYWNYLNDRAQKRRQQYQESLARGAAILRDSVAAGKTVERALEDVARRGPRAVQADFQEIVEEQRMGRPLDETLNRIRQRRQDPILDVLVENLLVHRRSGGQAIVPVMERLADATRRRAEVRRRVRAEQARVLWEARGVSLAPLIVLALSRFTIPQLMAPFYATAWGELAVVLVGIISAGTYYLVLKTAAAPLKLFGAVFVSPDELAASQAGARGQGGQAHAS